MKLINLTIRNFKGISNYELNLGGESASIFGDNAAGKTTVYDAFLWLLFGKDSSGRSDFSIKPIGRNMKGIDVEVEGTLAPDDGAEIHLRRVYSEVWTRKRGDVADVFTGHTTAYYIDGLPVTLAIYKKTVDSLIPEETFRILTNPLYFSATMKWQDRRRMLFDTFGGIADAEIASSDERFTYLLSMCGRYTVDEYKASLIKLLRKANEELKALPVRIDEASRLVMEDDSTVELQLEMRREQEAIAELTRKYGGIEIALREVRKTEEEEMAGIEMELEQLETAENKRIHAEHRENFAAYLKATEEIRRQLHALGLEKIDFERQGLIRDEARLSKELEALRSRYAHVSMETWSGSESCPTCGRAFDPASIQNAKQAFEAEKQAKLEAINQEGIAKKEERERISGEISAATIRYNAAASLASEYREAMESMREPELPPVSDEYKAKKAELGAKFAECQKRLTEILNSTRCDTRPLDEQSRKHTGRTNEIIFEILKREASQQARARIEELSAIQTKTADMAGEYEEMIALCEEWTRVRASRVQESINRHFAFVTWKLYKDQINGGMEECCEAMINGVPFADLNGASKINAGLDIIGAFAEATGKSAPVFVDNAESVTDLYTPAGVQTVRLVVSEADKQLRLQK